MKASSLHWALYLAVTLVAVAAGIVLAEKVLSKAEQAAAQVAA